MVRLLEFSEVIGGLNQQVVEGRPIEGARSVPRLQADLQPLPECVCVCVCVCISFMHWFIDT